MRKNRKLEQGATYHVSARSNRQEFIFQSVVLKLLFRHLLEQAKKKYGFKLKHLAIMSNHIHLLIEPHRSEDLPRIMQWVLSRFASRFNLMYGYKGHVWWDRYRSNIVKGPKNLLKTFKYISENPVKAGLAATVADYAFSAIALFKKKDYRLIEPPDELYQEYLASVISGWA